MRILRCTVEYHLGLVFADGWYGIEEMARLMRGCETLP